jgi:hypothetical protein
MATIPLWQLGKHLTSVVITAQTVSTVGVLADSTAPAAVTLTAYMDGLSVELANDEEEINALNSTRLNMVGLADGANVNLDVIKVNNSSDPQPLRTLILAADYFKVVHAEGTGGSAKTSTYYGKRGTYRDDFRGRGKQIASLSLSTIDVGSANYAVA